MVIRYAGWTTCATPWFITHRTPTEAIRKYYSPPLLKSLSRLVSPIPARAAWDGWTPLAELVQVVQVRKQKPFNINQFHLSSFIFHLYFILHPSSFIIRHLPSAICHLSIFHPTFIQFIYSSSSIHLFTYSPIHLFTQLHSLLPAYFNLNT